MLIGGEGTRLRPLTRRTPKQLVPILNRPLLGHLLRLLRAHGVDRVTLAATKPDAAIEAAFGDGSGLGLRIDRVCEGEPRGSGGAIALAARGWDEPFLVCNGDVVTDLDLGAFADAHRRRAGGGEGVTIALTEVDDPSRFGVAALGGDGRIERFAEKPPRGEAPSNLANTGVWLFDPGVARELDGDRFHRVEDDLFPRLAAAGGGIFGYRHEGYWADAGTPETYLRANLDLLAGAAPSLLPDPPGGLPGGGLAAGAGVEGPALLGAGTRIGGGARAEGGVVAGEGCTIGRGAALAGSVLWDGASVGEDARVRGAILADGARVGAGAEAEGAVLAQGAAIGPGERPPAGLRLDPGCVWRGGAVHAPAPAGTPAR